MVVDRANEVIAVVEELVEVVLSTVLEELTVVVVDRADPVIVVVLSAVLGWVYRVVLGLRAGART